LLDFIIRAHVKHAEPIGSTFVSERAGLDISPATIRSEMLELEDMGYLVQPHTSAGRVPTDKAYRHFVNALIERGEYDVDPKSKRKIEQAISQSESADPREASRNAAQILQELSDTVVIANIERSPDFFKFGLSSLMEFPEFREFDRMFQFASFFDQFDSVFQHMERQFFGDHIAENFNILIGRENPMRNIQAESMIIIRHRLPGGHVGTLTIVGPTRMDYRKNIGLAQYTGEVLNKLSDGN